MKKIGELQSDIGESFTEKVERKNREKQMNSFIHDFNRMREINNKEREFLRNSIKIKDNNNNNNAVLSKFIMFDNEEIIYN